MSITVIAPRPVGDDIPLDRAARAAGTADAYDEHRAGTPLAVLAARLQALTDHLHEVSDAYLAYVLGYADTVLTIRRSQQATSNAQAEIAFEDRENDR